MTLDYQSLSMQIGKIGENAIGYYQSLHVKRQQAMQSLVNYSNSLEILTEKVHRAARNQLTLRCALPVKEPLDGHFASDASIQGVVLFAADGSQVAPEQHSQVNFFMINIGTMRMQIGSVQTPRMETSSAIYAAADLYTPQGFITDEAVTLRRDLKERQVLIDLVKEEKKSLDASSRLESVPPIVTMTDGTLELWGAKERSQDGGTAFRKALTSHKDILQQLCNQEVITAAYVDKPRADLVIRLLEIAEMEEAHLDQISQPGNLQGVNDIDLFSNLLAEGERSSVFALHSQSSAQYQGDIALHFFYLNVGKTGNPWLARVEIPAWVARDENQLALLQAVIIEQCSSMGSNSYPYILHRAHESAVVTLQEKEQLVQMIAQEYLRRGIPVGQESFKQKNKNLGGRMRFKK